MLEHKGGKMRKTIASLEKIIEKKDKEIEASNQFLSSQKEKIDEQQKEIYSLSDEVIKKHETAMTYDTGYAYHNSLEQVVSDLRMKLENAERYIEYYKESNLLEENKKLRDHIVKLSMKVQWVYKNIFIIGISISAFLSISCLLLACREFYLDQLTAGFVLLFYCIFQVFECSSFLIDRDKWKIRNKRKGRIAPRTTIIVPSKPPTNWKINKWDDEMGSK